MKLRIEARVGLAVLALGLVPAMGMADGPNYQPGRPELPARNTEPPKGPKPRRKATPTATTAAARARNTSKARREPPSAVRESDGAG